MTDWMLRTLAQWPATITWLLLTLALTLLVIEEMT